MRLIAFFFDRLTDYQLFKLKAKVSYLEFKIKTLKAYREYKNQLTNKNNNNQ